MPVQWDIQTSTAAPGAVAVVQLSAAEPAELDEVLGRLGIPPVRAGQVALREFCGIDWGIAARWSETSIHLMPHGGPAVLRLLGTALDAAGLVSGPASPRQAYPEAATLLEARMLAALAEAASPLAVDLLLQQPGRWPREQHDLPSPAPLAEGEAPRELARLISPPLVVAAGSANVGKSSLVNALAGRGVSIVADEPGTTRDHVGVLIDMGGLVVRYIDTPGLRQDGGAIEREAAALALEVARCADLVLLCGDARAEPPALEQVGKWESRPQPPRHLRVALRADLGVPHWQHDAAVSAQNGEGLAKLVQQVREALVPQAALDDPRPWRFWEGV